MKQIFLEVLSYITRNKARDFREQAAGVVTIGNIIGCLGAISSAALIAEGVFFSLLTYGIQVYGGVWGLDNFNTAEARTKAFTKEDNNRLQVIMNKVLRSLTGLPKDTPVSLLLQESGYLSVHQLTAYHTLSKV